MKRKECNKNIIDETAIVTKTNPIFIKEIEDYLSYYIELNMKQFNDIRIKNFGKFFYNKRNEKTI